MLDLNITLVFQLVNFFIALYVLNLLLIRPIREIIRKRKAVMDDMSGESESYEYQAEQRLSDYDNQLTRARQDAGQNREKAREAGAAEQADLSALGIGGQQVDHLDAGLEDVHHGTLVFKGRGLPVDGPLLGGLHGAAVVDGVSQDVEHPA